MHLSATRQILCREIVDSDVSDTTDLLVQGFPRRRRQYWLNGFLRLANHPRPRGSPKYGYVLECNGTLVGVILLITSSIRVGNTQTIRCNLSSWFVAPAFRAFSPLLISRATSSENVTYVNVSPAPHTWPIIETQGFSRYGNGQFFAVPALRAPSSRTRVVEVDRTRDIPFGPFERDLLLAHSGYGCLSLWCSDAEGIYPFVFAPRMIKGTIPCIQLIYCRGIGDYVRFARPLGWHFASRGRPLVIIDSNEPIPGLTGWYFENLMPKYFKGPERPRLGDLAYTEAALFGF